ncbi:hypothetical protein DXB68_07965 [Bifidobacterium longum]|uniref:Uncharacterized protein n=1 Tax=Bifidobacterium longum TaxID=216816 RepID=A0AB37LEB2_BIFLN|nr:hypothetical protein DXC85_08995 [Bifidobacterium longum]RGN25292.1 hypothetical protein DXB68_07965 [Bifidobacterium longum]
MNAVYIIKHAVLRHGLILRIWIMLFHWLNIILIMIMMISMYYLNSMTHGILMIVLTKSCVRIRD